MLTVYCSLLKHITAYHIVLQHTMMFSCALQCIVSVNSKF